MALSPPANILLFPFHLSRVYMKLRIQTLFVNDNHLYVPKGKYGFHSLHAFSSTNPNNVQVKQNTFFFFFNCFRLTEGLEKCTWAIFCQNKWYALTFSQIICGFITSLLFVLVSSWAEIFCTASVIMFIMLFRGFSFKSVSIAPTSASFHSSSVKTNYDLLW